MSEKEAAVVLVATEINKRIDIKYIPEVIEQTIIESVTGNVLDLVDDFLPESGSIYRFVSVFDDGLSDDDVAVLLTQLRDAVNDLVDIPLLDEKQELYLLDLITSVVADLIKNGASV